MDAPIEITAMQESNEAVDVTEDETAQPTKAAVPQTRPFDLEHALPLNPDSFHNQPRKGSNAIPTTIANVKHLLKMYCIIVRYNVISKS